MGYEKKQMLVFDLESKSSYTTSKLIGRYNYRCIYTTSEQPKILNISAHDIILIYVCLY